jgi:iduronate 2-sulfatase
LIEAIASGIPLQNKFMTIKQQFATPLLIALCSLSGVCATAAESVRRPNVLFIISDDLSSRITPAGYAGVQTPVLDRLASEAVTFRNAYCQYPVCGPSRASFLTGLYPESTGVLDNTTDIAQSRPGTPSLPGVFRAAGYWTAAVGKVFHRPLDNPGGNTWDVTEAFENDEMAVEKAAREKFEAVNGPITDGKNRKAWKELALTIAPQTRNQGVKGLGPGYGPTGLTEAQHSDGKNARLVAAWITNKVHGDRPFLIACGFQKPHIPFLAPDAYFKAYPKESLRFTLDPTNDWNDIPAIADTKQYLDYGFPAKGQENDARRREFAQAYYACISFIDTQLGIIMDALKQSGQWDNTIIVFIGDNGYHLGEHFMWGKVMLFEESAKVPMLVHVPGLTRNKGIANGLVELVDIFPTLAELCSVTPPANLQGRSIVPLIKDPAAVGKNYAYTVVRRSNELGYAIRFDRWRYTEWVTPEQCELYDLAADPREWTNLAGKPEHQDVVRRASKLLAELRQTAAQQKAKAGSPWETVQPQ